MKSEICANCTHYTPYYEEYCSFFSKLNHSSCKKRSERVTQRENCEFYKSNVEKEKRREKDRIADLDKAIQRICEIAQILKEKEEDCAKRKV